MAYIGNSPEQATILRLEARKSFALSLWFMDSNRRPADLTSATVRLVVKTPPFTDDPGDGANLIEHDVAEFPDPTQGFARFELQASELNLAPGEYPYVIVLLSDGYSSVVVKGYIAVEGNPEFSSMDSTYDDIQAPMGLDVILRTGASIDVICGAVVPPGFTWLSDADKAKVDSLSIAGNLLPEGGDTRQILAKASPADYDFTWADPQAFDGTLSAASVAAGRAPVADGTGLWSWAAVPSITTGVSAGRAAVADGVGGWSWGFPAQQSSVSMGTANLNDQTTTGFFHPQTPSTATLARNYPVEDNGVLQVISAGSTRTIQIYTTNEADYPGGGRQFVRARYGSTSWTAWRESSWDGHTHVHTDITDMLDADQVPRVIDLNGISRGTADPTGGEDGDLYIKVLP